MHTLHSTDTHQAIETASLPGDDAPNTSKRRERLLCIGRVPLLLRSSGQHIVPGPIPAWPPARGPISPLHIVLWKTSVPTVSIPWMRCHCCWLVRCEGSKNSNAILKNKNQDSPPLVPGVRHSAAGMHPRPTRPFEQDSSPGPSDVLREFCIFMAGVSKRCGCVYGAHVVIKGAGPKFSRCLWCRGAVCTGTLELLFVSLGLPCS